MTISNKRMAEIGAIPDEGIDMSEIPVLDDAFFKKAKLMLPRIRASSDGVQLKTYKDVESWLGTRKPEEIALFAARTTLRVLPMLAKDEREDMPAAVLLPVLRAAAAPWFAGAWPDFGGAVTSFADCAARHAASIARTASDPCVARAARSSASAARTAVFDAVTARAASAAAACLAAHVCYPSRAMAQADNLAATALEKGATVAELSAMPLWPDGKTPGDMVRHWHKLKSRLPKREDWDVWVEWYEDRLRGTRADKELEKARILIPDEDWKQGPAHVNAIIKRLTGKGTGKRQKIGKLSVAH